MIAWLFPLALIGAGPSPEELVQASRYFEAGNEAYRSGQYLPAARAYEAALECAPLSAIRFTLAQTYRRQFFLDGDLEWLQRARGLYQQYLAEEPSGRRREHAVSHIAIIDTILLTKKEAPATTSAIPRSPATELMIWSKAHDARASIDGGPLFGLPFTASATSGTYRVHGEAPGHDSVNVDAVAIAGRIAVLELQLQPKKAWIDVQSEGMVALDGWVVGDGPRRVSTNAGRHSIGIFVRGYDPYTRTASIAAGDSLTLDPLLSPSLSGRAQTMMFWGAGVLAAGAIGTGLGAFARERDALGIERAPLKQSRNLSAEEASAFDGAVRSRDAMRTVSLALISGAALMAAAGAVLYVLDEPNFEGTVAF